MEEIPDEKSQLNETVVATQRDQEVLLDEVRHETDSIDSETISEQQSSPEGSRPITVTHGNGETYTAMSPEEAAKKCPVLGKMSLDKVGILLEMTTKGDEILSKRKQGVESQRSKQEEAVNTHKQSLDTTNEQVDPKQEEVVPLVNETTLAQQYIEEVVAGQKTVESFEHPEITSTEKVRASSQPEAVRALEKVSGSQSLVTETSQSTTVLESEKHSLEISAIIHEKAVIMEDPTTLENTEQDVIDVTEKIPSEVNKLQSTQSFETSSIFEKFIEQTGIEQSAEWPAVITIQEAGGVFETAISDLGGVVGPIELPAPKEEVADIMEQVLEATNSPDQEVTEKVNEILTSIIQLPISVETESATEQVEAEIRIRQLFTELFKTLEIEITPEQLESFVLLSKRHYFEALPIQEANIIEKNIGEQAEIGTREFLQKIHHGLAKLHWKMLQLYKVGRSALQSSGLSY